MNLSRLAIRNKYWQPPDRSGLLGSVGGCPVGQECLPDNWLPGGQPPFKRRKALLLGRDVNEHHFIREDGAKFELSAKGCDIPLQRGHIEIGFAFEPRDVGLSGASGFGNLHLGLLTRFA